MIGGIQKPIRPMDLPPPIREAAKDIPRATAKFAAEDDPRKLVDSSWPGKKEALSKNLCYEGMADALDGDSAARYLHVAMKVAGMSAVLEALMKVFHIREGSQLQVESNVSRDLLLTDMTDVRIDEIPFPSRSLEFFFEDPNLPTVLVTKGKLSDVIKTLGLEGVAVDSDEKMEEDSINFWCESVNGTGLAFRARPSNWSKLIVSETSEIETLVNSVQYSPEDWHVLREMFSLCVKVLAYASIPYLAPKEITRKTGFRQGKPGVKGRPNTPMAKVVYLPEVSRDYDKAEESGKQRAFHGRRGTVRYYRSKRYRPKEQGGVRNTFQYVPPIPGPNGEIPKALFKVRKPRTGRPSKDLAQATNNNNNNGTDANSTPITA